MIYEVIENGGRVLFFRHSREVCYVIEGTEGRRRLCTRKLSGYRTAQQGATDKQVQTI